MSRWRTWLRYRVRKKSSLSDKSSRLHKLESHMHETRYSRTTMSKRTLSEDSLRRRTKPRLDSPQDPNLELSLSYPDTCQLTAKQTPFQQPVPLLSFSYNSSHQLEFSDSALRYFIDPPRGANLAYGYERWVRKPDERGRIDGLLQAFTRARERDSSSFLQGVGVIAWRGVMTRYAYCLLRNLFWLTRIRSRENINITL